MSRETTLSKLFHLYSEKGSTLREKSMHPLGVDPSSEEALCAGKQA